MKLETLLEFDFLYLEYCLSTLDMHTLIVPICIVLYFTSLYKLALSKKKLYRSKANSTLSFLIKSYTESENMIYKQELMNRISRLTVKLDLHSELNSILENTTSRNVSNELKQLQQLKTHILETNDYLYTAMLNA